MYVYQADVWCDECGEEIRARLDETIDPKGDGVQTMNDTDDGDSDGYPQWADEDDSESDTPSHCAAGEDCKNRVRCGEICGTSTPFYAGAILGGLTSDGREYVLDHLRTDEERSEVVLVWREHFELDWPEECRTVYLYNMNDDPTQVMCQVKQTYAADWADDDQTIDGSSWETPPDMPGFAYTIIMDRQGLAEELESQGYVLDQSEYSECDAEQFAIAHAACDLGMNYSDVEVLWEFATAEVNEQLQFSLPAGLIQPIDDTISRTRKRLAVWRKENGK